MNKKEKIRKAVSFGKGTVTGTGERINKMDDEAIVDNETEVYDPVYDIRFYYKKESWMSHELCIGGHTPIKLSANEVLALYDVLRRVRNELSYRP